MTLSPVPVGTVVLELTQRCNLDCLHCYNVWKGPRPYPSGELGADATLALVDKLLDEVGPIRLTLSGGEPLLRADLDQLLSHLAARGARVNLLTNGLLLDRARIARLADRVDLFELPLLSADRRIHDELVGVPGAFDRVTDAIAELKLAGHRVVTVFVATRLNLPGFRDTAELALALGADALMFNRLNPGGRAIANLARLQASPAELTAALAVADDLAAGGGLPISCSIPMPPCLFTHAATPNLGFGFCAAGTDRAYPTVDPLGNVRPCNHSPTILGNLASSSLSELARGRPLERFVAAVPAFCAGCAAAAACRGSCKAAGEACTGDPSALDPFVDAYRGLVRRPGRVT